LFHKAKNIKSFLKQRLKFKELLMNTSGNWKNLYDQLNNSNEPVIILTDEEIQFNIVESEDNIRPYPLDSANSSYSIRKIAQDAGYSVSVHPLNKRVKIFSKIP